MKCLSCGGDTRVVDTDKYETTVVRIRKCLCCGASETTDEVPRMRSNVFPMYPASTRSGLQEHGRGLRLTGLPNLISHDEDSEG